VSIPVYSRKCTTTDRGVKPPFTSLSNGFSRHTKPLNFFVFAFDLSPRVESRCEGETGWLDPTAMQKALPSACRHRPLPIASENSKREEQASDGRGQSMRLLPCLTTSGEACSPHRRRQELSSGGGTNSLTNEPDRSGRQGGTDSGCHQAHNTPSSETYRA
jgi:hypothetical protein